MKCPFREIVIVEKCKSLHIDTITKSTDYCDCLEHECPFFVHDKYHDPMSVKCGRVN